jgi:hypothetical protein
MNLRVSCLALALLSIAATGDPCSSSSTGTGTTTSVGKNGAVCDNTVNTPCCAAVDQPCGDNNDCCTGNCSGSGGGDGGGLGGSLVDSGSTCAEPFNEGCTVALSSRCNEGECTCTTDTDCCIGSCAPTSLPGASGLRCCLTTGLPCDADADCCSLSCQASGQCQ